MPGHLKDRILDAASKLFYRKGIKATGVDEIVKSANTTKMSLYKYFPSKDDLVLAYLQKNATEMRARITNGIDRRATDPKEKLIAVFGVFEEMFGKSEFRGCPFINASAEFAPENNPVQQASAEFYEGLRNTLTGIAIEANAKNPMELANQIILLIAGAIISEQLKRGSGALQAARHAAKVLIESSF